MSLLRASLALGLCSFFSLFSLADDWPTYQQNNDRAGSNSEQLDWPLANEWTLTVNDPSAESPLATAWAGPRSEPIEGQFMRHRSDYDASIPVVAVGDRVYFGSSVDHHLYCVSNVTGETLWRFATEGPIRLAPTVADGKVYFGSDDGWAYCLNAEDGALVWQFHASPFDERLLARGDLISRWAVRTSVLVDNGVAYFAAGIFPHETIYLCAVDAESGRIIWRNDAISQEDASRNDVAPQGYLLCSDELLFVPTGRAQPAAFDRATGELRYRSAHSRWSESGVVGGVRALLADGQIYTAGPHHYLALDQTNGQIGYAWILGRQMVVAGDKAYCATGETISAVSRTEHAAASRERNQFTIRHYNLTRSFQRGNISEEEYREQAAVFDAEIEQKLATGRLWQVAASDEGALIATSGAVIVGGEGRVVAFHSESGEEIWSAEVEGTCRSLSVANGRLYASTDLGRIYAFGPAGTTNEIAMRGVAEQQGETPFADDAMTPVYAKVAEEIGDNEHLTNGYCLVVGSEEGRLAYAISQASHLRVICVESDEEKVLRSREVLTQAGLYGTRIVVLHMDLDHLALPNYFANVIVSDTLLRTGDFPGSPGDVARHLKPCGGIALLGPYSDSLSLSQEKIASILEEFGLEEGEINMDDGWGTLTRGTLPGASEWTHQYGTPGNTACVADSRVRGNLGVLWYGDPGPELMASRHAAAAAPLSTGGRMFIQGIDRLMAYDAYNGTFLWEYMNEGAQRLHLKKNSEISHLAAGDDYLFVAIGSDCVMLDVSTGDELATFTVPDQDDEVPLSWEYTAFVDGHLLGSSAVSAEDADRLRRQGISVSRSTRSIFAFDADSREIAWVYTGQNVIPTTLAAGDGRVFFVDSSISDEQRLELLRTDRAEYENLTPEEQQAAEQELKDHDVRMAVALDLATGEEIWSRPIDVTNCSEIGIGGGKLTLLYSEGHLVFCGANANGHYWNQFVAGEFNQRRLVVLDASTGEQAWAKDANYRIRPVIVGNEVIAEPWAYNLVTGEQKMRVNPITGEESPWQFIRPGHHCGMVSSTPDMLFFRSLSSAYYDLRSDSGTSHFAGQRVGCCISMIPGNGLVMMPETSAGCVCSFSYTATIVLEPREDRNDWRLYSLEGAGTPVQQLSINLAAPGDRRNAEGNLWLAYPRPWTRDGLELPLEITIAGGTKYARNSESIEVARTETPWVYTSGLSGEISLEVELLSEEDPATEYIVELLFAEPEGAEPGERVFDIQIGGSTVAEGVDIARESSSAWQAHSLRFENIEVTDKLVIQLNAAAGSTKPPVLSAIRVQRQE